MEAIKDYVNDFIVDVYELEINQENFKILIKRIEKFCDFHAFQRIIFDFAEFLTPHIKTKLILNARSIFAEI